MLALITLKWLIYQCDISSGSNYDIKLLNNILICFNYADQCQNFTELILGTVKRVLWTKILDLDIKVNSKNILNSQLPFVFLLPCCPSYVYEILPTQWPHWKVNPVFSGGKALLFQNCFARKAEHFLLFTLARQHPQSVAIMQSRKFLSKPNPLALTVEG